MVIKLNKTEKEQLTLKWLCELVKTENLSIQDVMDILNCVDSSFSRTDKLNSLVYNGTITAVSQIAEISQMGIEYFLLLLPLLAMNLALFNVLPIPSLDGARAIFGTLSSSSSVFCRHFN